MSTRETRGFLDPASFPAAALLESNFDVIAAELAECDDNEFVDWSDTTAYSGV